jgi:hypothetical protein
LFYLEPVNLPNLRQQAAYVVVKRKAPAFQMPIKCSNISYKQKSDSLLSYCSAILSQALLPTGLPMRIIREGTEKMVLE